MWTPALGWQMAAALLSSILRTESVKGPVALITHLALTSNSCPVKKSGIDYIRRLFSAHQRWITSPSLNWTDGAEEHIPHCVTCTSTVIEGATQKAHFWVNLPPNKSELKRKKSKPPFHGGSQSIRKEPMIWRVGIQPRGRALAWYLKSGDQSPALGNKSHIKCLWPKD